MAVENKSVDLAINIDADNAARELDKLESSIEKTASAVDGLAGAEAALANASKTLTEGVSRQSAALDRIERAFLPTEAAATKYTRAVERLNVVIAQNGTNSERAKQILAGLQAQYTASGVALTRAAGSMDDASSSLTRHLGGVGGVAQQAGYQIADLATQISMGQNAVSALAVQGGQLIGAFGPMGAVIGAVVTVVGAMAVAMGAASKETEKSEDILAKYNGIISETDGLIQNAVKAGESLREGQKEEVDTVDNLITYYKSLTSTMKDLERIRLISKKDEVSSGLAKIKEDARSQVGELRSLYHNVQDIYGVRTNKDLLGLTDFFDSMKDFESATDPEAISRLAISLQKISETSAPAYKGEEIKKTASDAAKILAEPAIKAIELKKKLDEVEAALGAVEKAGSVSLETGKKVEGVKELASVTDEWGQVVETVEQLERERQETIARVTSSIDDQIQALKNEQAMLGLSERDRAIRVAELKAEAEYKKAGVAIDEERLAQLREETASLYDLKAAQSAQAEEARKAEAERKQAMEAAVRQQEQMVDSITEYGADRITDSLMENTSKGWKEMLSGMWDDFKAFLVRAAAEAALRPIAVSLVGGVMGSGFFGSSGNAATAAVSAGGASSGFSVGSLSSIGSLFSGGGSTMLRDAGNWFATSSVGRSLGLSSNAIGGSIDAAGVSLTGAGEALSSGLQYSPYGAIGGIGASLLGLGSKNPWINAGTGLAGSVAGGAIGSSMGTILGVAGGPVGAILGGFLGTALGGLFGGKKKADGADTYLGVAEGLSTITGQRSYRGGDVSRTNAMASAYVDAVNKIAETTGGSLTASPVSSFGYVGKYNEFYANGVGKYGSAEDAVKAALDATLRNPAVWSGLSEDIQAAMKNSVGDISQLGQDIDFAMQYRDTLKEIAGDLDEATAAAEAQAAAMTAQYEEMSKKVKALGLDMDATDESFESGLRILLGLKEAEPALSDTEKAVALVKAQFEALTPLMDQFGISAEEAATGLQARLDELRTGFDEGIASQIQQIVDPLGYQLEVLAEAQAQRLVEAKAVGADLVEVERLNGLERMALLQDQGDQIREYLDAQILGSTSTLSGADKLVEAQRQYGVALEAARGGDTTALGKITSLSDSVLSAARDMYASSTNYSTIESMIRSQLESLGQTLGLPGFASGTLSAPAGMAWVGEQGPELISFRGGEQVFSAGQSAAMGETMRADSRASARLLAELVAETRTLRQQNAELVDGQSRLNNRLNLLLSKSA